MYILLALADQERHGYGIMREVEERTGGKVTIWPATLYGAIKRMLAAGLIEAATAPERPDPGETARLAQIVELAREKQVLGTPDAVA